MGGGNRVAEKSSQMGGAAGKPIDEHQLRRLFDAHGAALALYARQWRHDPEDALQEAFIDLWRQAPAPDQPAAWLFKTVRRRAMNQARAEQRRAAHHRRAGEQRESWFYSEEESAFEPRELESMLSSLPPLEREIVVARIWGELTFEQIAELVELSTSAVHRRYHGALSRLEQMIGGKLNESK
jgi:RNA polymerase sigma-70 factor (ECF subfamily)